MANHGRKFARALALAALCLLLGGCATNVSTDKLYALPSLPAEYASLEAEINALLSDEAHIRLRPGELLNKELRIYALLRLGITDSAKIASFLRCSLSTVYNYRTRMRNRACIPKEEFEKRITEIGNSREKEGLQFPK